MGKGVTKSTVLCLLHLSHEMSAEARNTVREGNCIIWDVECVVRIISVKMNLLFVSLRYVSALLQYIALLQVL